MTNKEILQADLLDILFEHRNKAYGAYALRKGYDTRLLKALGAGLGLVAIFCVVGLTKENTEPLTDLKAKEEILIKEYVMPVKKIEEPPKPEPPKKQPAPQKPVVKTAQVKYVSQFDIKKDELVKTPVAPVESFTDKKIGDEEIKGKPDENIVKTPDPPGTAVVSGTGTAAPDNFMAQESAPEFPGGPNALYQYLAKNLNTPGELETGDKIMVKVRFKVDVDGAVTGFEIVESGGTEYDKEVLRVVKKMPRWKPGFQNGVHVAVNYMIPVTFIGTE